eukprot:m.435109 g.435109  ORF g.435109 m.435109 type:complete len:353 (+) comp56761_c1_seq3:1827-2885(+)
MDCSRKFSMQPTSVQHVLAERLCTPTSPSRPTLAPATASTVGAAGTGRRNAPSLALEIHRARTETTLHPLPLHRLHAAICATSTGRRIDDRTSAIILAKSAIPTALVMLPHPLMVATRATLAATASPQAIENRRATVMNLQLDIATPDPRAITTTTTAAEMPIHGMTALLFATRTQTAMWLQPPLVAAVVAHTVRRLPATAPRAHQPRLNPTRMMIGTDETNRPIPTSAQRTETTTLIPTNALRIHTASMTAATPTTVALVDTTLGKRALLHRRTPLQEARAAVFRPATNRLLVMLDDIRIRGHRHRKLVHRLPLARVRTRTALQLTLARVRTPIALPLTPTPSIGDSNSSA